MRVACRIITEGFDDETKLVVVSYLTAVLEKYHIGQPDVSDITTYWKNNKLGEINCEFVINDNIFDNIKQEIADNWQLDVADKNWSNIHCPKVEFIWMRKV